MKRETNINFVGMSRFWIIFSTVAIIISFASFIVRGFNYGIDFVGGTAISVQFNKNTKASAEGIRRGLAKIQMENATVQEYGEKEENEYLIKAGLPTSDLEDYEGDFKKAINAVLKSGNEIASVKFATDKMYVVLKQKDDPEGIKKAIEGLKIPNISIESVKLYGKESNREYLVEFMGVTQVVSKALSSVFGADTFKVIKVDRVGRKVGRELRTDAILASFIALFFILIYIWLRFEMEFAPGAVVCLIHDAIITAGVFSVFGLEIDTTFVAAILTIVGYSINDTIVVYDRIRENLITLKSQSFVAIVNRSINQTLSRTILTSVTVLMVTIVILIYGGPILFNMALALTIGVFVGSYSTIFIATPLTLYLNERFFTKKRV